MIHIHICQPIVNCCKPSVAKGFAASNSFLTLLSPCSEGSGETLARRFHVPTTRTLTPILSAADIYASGQSLRTERLYADQSADSHCRASPWGNHSRVQLSSSLRPQRHFPSKLSRGSASSKRGHFPRSRQLHQRSLKLTLSNSTPEGTQGNKHQAVSTSTDKSSVCGTDTPFPTR